MEHLYRGTRRLRGDEYHAVAMFQEHADTCFRCRNPVECRLCVGGQGLADDVAGYLQKDGGHCIALRPIQHHQADQVHLPPDFDAVHRLLKALENGLSLDPLEPGRARGFPPPPDGPIEIIERQPRAPPPDQHIVRNSRLFRRRPIIVCRRGPTWGGRIPSFLRCEGSWREARTVTIRVTI